MKKQNSFFKKEVTGFNVSSLRRVSSAIIICMVLLAAFSETASAQWSKPRKSGDWKTVISPESTPQSVLNENIAQPKVTAGGPTWGNEPPSRYGLTPVFDMVNEQTGKAVACYYDKDKMWLWTENWNRYLTVTPGSFLEFEKTDPENPIFKYERDKDQDGYFVVTVLEDGRPKWPETRIDLSNNQKSKWHFVWW